jgi:hypothetical protein
MTAIMTSESGDIEKVAEIIHECEKMKIKVLPPNVNESYGGFTVIKGSDHATDRTIRFGFYNIKNLGVDIADAIIEERKKNGHFKSLADFLETIVRNTQAAVQAGMKNMAAERAIGVAVQLNEASRLKEQTSRPGTVTVLENGKPVATEGEAVVGVGVQIETIVSDEDGRHFIHSPVDVKVAVGIEDEVVAVGGAEAEIAGAGKEAHGHAGFGFIPVSDIGLHVESGVGRVEPDAAGAAGAERAGIR